MARKLGEGILLMSLLLIVAFASFCFGEIRGLSTLQPRVTIIKQTPPSPFAPPKWKVRLGGSLWYWGDAPLVIDHIRINEYPDGRVTMLGDACGVAIQGSSLTLRGSMQISNVTIDRNTTE